MPAMSTSGTRTSADRETVRLITGTPKVPAGGRPALQENGLRYRKKPKCRPSTIYGDGASLQVKTGLTRPSVVQVNYAFDKELADPAALLERYTTLTGWAEALGAAGARRSA